MNTCKRPTGWHWIDHGSGRYSWCCSEHHKYWCFHCRLVQPKHTFSNKSTNAESDSFFCTKCLLALKDYHADNNHVCTMKDFPFTNGTNPGDGCALILEFD